MSALVAESLPAVEDARTASTPSDIEARLARIEALLAGLAEDARRDRERWDAIDELIRDAGPFVGQALGSARTHLQRLQDKGYGEVLGASAKILDQAVEEFDAESVDAIGENLLVLLRTLRRMS